LTIGVMPGSIRRRSFQARTMEARSRNNAFASFIVVAFFEIIGVKD
jgi:hypothetical protein